MGNPNEHTDWEAQAGPGEARLSFKEPQGDHDPNVGTQWEPPVDESKPRVRVPRDIDKFIDRPTWTCPDCGHSTLTENGKAAHLAMGGDGMTPCQRDKARFKPVKNCNKCGGTGRGAGQCPSCKGSGEGEHEAKCRGCNGRGVLREGSTEQCNVCQGSGKRSYCAPCNGSGEVTHCAGCNGTGKIQGDEAEAAPANPIDQDAMAEKISGPIIKTMNEGFLMLAEILSGKKIKVPKKKAKAARGGTKGVSRVASTRGSEPVSGVEQPDQPVGDLPPESQEA